MNLTYGQLHDKIANMTDEEKAMNVTVYVRDMDEYFPIESCKATGDCDGVLDEGHQVLFTPKNNT